MNKNKEDIKRNIKITPKPDSISWEEITEVIQLAFSEKKDRGLLYVATQQDAQKTQERVGNGICIVALLDDKVIGTVTLQIEQIDKRKRKWYHGNLSAYSSQLAVHPDYKGFGVGNMLSKERFRIAEANNVDELLMHTSVHATEMLTWWKRQGGQFVELLSSSSTNYYAIRCRIPVKAKRFSDFYVAIRYYWSYLYCVLTKTEGGKPRSWVTFLKKNKK
jgi:ribosomal protein S18 acetylase RimI-like enzyme